MSDRAAESSLTVLRREIRAAANPAKAKVLAGFFKTGKGEYGEGDVFLGLTVPISRGLAQRHRDLPLADVRRLLASRVHEERLVALLILVDRYDRGGAMERQHIFDFYLRHAERADNWDLVDLSADKIVGRHLLATAPRAAAVRRLAALARASNLWRRRIAIVATFAFIRAGDFAPTFRVADALMRDKHDLIHKATGWMLREVGKRDKVALTRWLKPRAARMPRTMLRYAIERFPERERGKYLLKV